ncbi:MAG TPA: WGxxGxxG family protein [Sphingomicrobium sp.]
MRVTLLLAAFALTVAGPAVAQDTTTADNADASVGVVDNTAAVDANVLAGNVTVDNTVAVDPGDMPVEEEVAPVTARRQQGFPWGILGLIGLVGLLGRRRG